MTEPAAAAVIDLRDKTTPPPDDPVNAPYGFRWDTKKREWAAKRSAGGRKAGTAWFGKNTPDEPEEQQEVVTEAPGDPSPAWMSKSAPKPVKRTLTVKKAVRDDISAAVGMMIMLGGPPLMAKDPYCAGAVMDNAQKITDAVVPLLCRSHTVVAFFSDTSENGWMLWFNLAIALSPVVMAVGRHHIVKSVEIQQDDNGQLFIVPRDLSEYAA